MFDPELERTLHRALHLAEERKHRFATMEHLLLALTEDASAERALDAIGADLLRLRDTLVSYLDTELERIKSDRMDQAKPTAGFQRCLQRASMRVLSDDRTHVTGLDLLIALFSERESHAVYFLGQQDVDRDRLVEILRKSAKGRSRL